MQIGVYIVDPSTGITGAYKCAENISHALRGRARVTLVRPRRAQLRGSDIKSFDEVLLVTGRQLRKGILAIMCYAPSLVYDSCRIRWSMWRTDSSVLVLNDYYLLHGLVCRLLGYRGRIITWVRFDPCRFPRGLSTVYLECAKRASDQIVVVSRYIGGRDTRLKGARVVYDSSPVETRQSDIDSASLRFVYVGNYIEGKGQADALQAFIAYSKLNMIGRMDFYGGTLGLKKNIKYKAGLKEKIETAGLSHRVELGGFIDDVAGKMAGALAVLNFSESESFSLTVLEAQAAGIAVIATRCGGPAEIVVQGETGILVGVGNHEDMVQAMLKLSRDIKLSRRLGTNAHRMVKANFGWARYSASISEIVAGDQAAAGH